MQCKEVNRLRARLSRLGCTDICIFMLSAFCCCVSFTYQNERYIRNLNFDQWNYYPTITYNF